MPNSAGAGAGYWRCKRIIVQTSADDALLSSVLKDQWEPFAVTISGMGQYIYHLKKWIRLP